MWASSGLHPVINLAFFGLHSSGLHPGIMLGPWRVDLRGGAGGIGGHRPHVSCHTTNGLISRMFIFMVVMTWVQAEKGIQTSMV